MSEESGSAMCGEGPLSGVRVVEMGSFIAGPFCGQLLADLGADVTKIEPPGTGDAIRQWGRPAKDGRALWWSVIGRNKHSITLDLHTAKGRALARSLILASDVLVENFRPGTLEKWGLGPDDLRKDKPSLIVARVSGYGQTGPYSHRPGFAAVAEAAAGLRCLTGYPDRIPTRVGISIGDTLAGMFAAIGVLAAMIAAPRLSGRGQVVDVAIAESVLAVLESVIAEYSSLGIVRKRTGAVLPGLAPSNLYPTADGDYVLIAANADKLFISLATAMNEPGLAADPRYATHQARGEFQEELDARIAAWTSGKTRAEILDLMECFSIPAGPVNDAAAVAADPHFRARGAVINIPLDDGSVLAMQGAFPKLSETPSSVRWPGQALGESVERVLAERLGYTREQIDALRSEGVI